MLVEPWVRLPSWLSLLIIISILIFTGAVSLLATRHSAARTE
jgi:hypothetical protein